MKTKFESLLKFYRNHLLHDIMPFWLKYAIDWEYGGIYTGISDNGSLYTTNKFLWSNTRAIYIFSALYNYLEKNNKWLDVATNILEFCLKHGRDKHGNWVFLVDNKGNMLEGAKTIQVDCYAITGLTEYAKATGDKRALETAIETFYSVKKRLLRPSSKGNYPYSTPKNSKNHSEYFQFALAFFELGILIKQQDIIDNSLILANGVMDNFRRPEKKVLLEYISIGNKIIDSPGGRVMVPGHTIESMWIMIHIFRQFNNQKRIQQALETIKWGMEKGWDYKYGGILHGIDIAGKEPPYWKNAETKIWWAFAEALYTLLLAYEHSHEAWCLDWYWKVHDWTFSHFPDKEHGEWTQKLDRQGNRINTVVALPVKDPYHLPRAMIFCIDVLERLKGVQR